MEQSKGVSRSSSTEHLQAQWAALWGLRTAKSPGERQYTTSTLASYLQLTSSIDLEEQVWKRSQADTSGENQSLVVWIFRSPGHSEPVHCVGAEVEYCSHGDAYSRHRQRGDREERMIFHITGGPCLVPVRLSQPDKCNIRVHRSRLYYKQDSKWNTLLSTSSGATFDRRSKVGKYISAQKYNFVSPGFS